MEWKWRWNEWFSRFLIDTFEASVWDSGLSRLAGVDHLFPRKWIDSTRFARSFIYPHNQCFKLYSNPRATFRCKFSHQLNLILWKEILICANLFSLNWTIWKVIWRRKITSNENKKPNKINKVFLWRKVSGNQKTVHERHSLDLHSTKSSHELHRKYLVFFTLSVLVCLCIHQILSFS